MQQGWTIGTARVVDGYVGRHSPEVLGGAGVTTIEIVYRERMARASAALPDPDRGLGWFGQLSLAVLIAGAATAAVMLAALRVLDAVLL